MNIKLLISIKYLESGNWVSLNTGENVYEWVQNYLKRNRIPNEIKYIDNCKGNYLHIYFKSENQQRVFVQRGNSVFPYFEFW